VPRRKVSYPPSRSAQPAQPAGQPDDAPYVRPTVAIIDPNASKGRAGFAIGARVRITGTGLYSGETAVIERMSNGVIPSAVVRTEAGKSRQVRTIDLEPAGPAAPKPAASKEATPEAAAPGEE
jgi:hypothetical protein